MKEKRKWNITSGVIHAPLKGVIYGENGIGKTFFCTQAKNALIFDLEGNTKAIDHIKWRQDVDSFEEFESFLKNLVEGEEKLFDEPIKTIIIDSLWKLDVYITKEIDRTMTKTDQSYGNGESRRLTLFQGILEKLDFLHENKKMNILLIGHDTVKKSVDPCHPTFDKHTLRLSSGPEKLIGDWAYFVLFARKEPTIASMEDLGFGKKINKAGDSFKKIFHTENSPIYYAKNGYNLPPIIDMDWNIFKYYVEKFYLDKSLNQTKVSTKTDTDKNADTNIDKE